MPLRTYLLGILLTLSVGIGHATGLRAFTEESAPYNFTRAGRVAGIATDLFLAACAKAKIRCTVESMPWARSYAIVSSTPNTVIFSMVRRPDREDLFQWLAPVDTETVWLFGRADSPTVQDVQELRAYRTSVINGSSIQAFLTQAGIPAAALDLSNNIQSGLRKLQARRVDFVVNTETRIEGERQAAGLEGEVRKLIKLFEATTYFAAHPATDKASLQALRAALADLAADGTRASIFKKYQAGVR